MAARGAHRHAVAQRADGRAAQLLHVAVERHDLPQPVPVAREERPAALEIAEPLLARIQRKDDAARRFRPRLCDVRRREKQQRDVRGVVADAGAEHFAVPLCKRHRLRIGENGVGMRHEEHDRLRLLRAVRVHGVLGLIDENARRAVCLKPRLAKCGTLFLFMARRGNGAERPKQRGRLAFILLDIPLKIHVRRSPFRKKPRPAAGGAVKPTFDSIILCILPSRTPQARRPA